MPGFSLNYLPKILSDCPDDHVAVITIDGVLFVLDKVDQDSVYVRGILNLCIQNDVSRLINPNVTSFNYWPCVGNELSLCG